MTADNKVWVVDDDKSIRWVLERALARERLEGRSCFRILLPVEGGDDG